MQLLCEDAVSHVVTRVGQLLCVSHFVRTVRYFLIMRTVSYYISEDGQLLCEVAVSYFRSLVSYFETVGYL